MIEGLLDRTQTELAALAVAGLAGSQAANLAELADELGTAGLGKLGERLRAVTSAQEAPARMGAWAASWAGVDLVRRRLLKPEHAEPGKVVVLPQAPRVVLPRPEGDLDSVDGLLAVLQGPDPLARAYAAGRLAELGDAALPGLRHVHKTCGRCLRFLAIEATARIGTPAAVADLVALLGDDDVARPLESALLRLPQGRAAEPVATALAQAKAKDTARRRAAAKILWRMGAGQALEASLADPDELVKACAQAATWPSDRLARCMDQETGLAGWPVALALFERGLVAPDVLFERLDALPRKQWAAAGAVAWHTGAERPLAAHYMQQRGEGRRSKDREGAAVILRHLLSPDTLGLLHRRLVSPDYTGQVWETLAELGDTDTVWSLIWSAEHSPSGMWRSELFWVLGRIGDPAAVPFLVKALLEGRVTDDQAAVGKALAAIGAPAVPAVGQALLHLEPAHETSMPDLEWVLTEIGTPKAKHILREFRTNTDELTRLLGYLVDRQVKAKVIDDVARQGDRAFERLLAMLSDVKARWNPKNVALALAKMAPTLEPQHRERLAQVVKQRLVHECKSVTPGLHPYWQPNTVAPTLVAILCSLDVSTAVPAICSALPFVGVGTAILDSWQRDRRPWIVDVLELGIRAPGTCWPALKTAAAIAADPSVFRRLWPPIDGLLQVYPDVPILTAAVQLVRAGGDPAALPALRALQARSGTLGGYSGYRQQLAGELDVAIAELEVVQAETKKKRSIVGRLLGK